MIFKSSITDRTVVDVIRVILLSMIIVASSAHAGFKMFGPNGHMNSSETDEERSARLVREAKAQKQLFEISSEKSLRPQQPRDDFDLSGVEWRQMRGSYSGRAAKEMTKKFGYRAGKYRLEYRYKAHRHFAIWLHSRRGLSELLVNQVGSADTFVDFTLPKDDEIWFEVHSPFGNWEFTFERVGY